MYVCKHMFTLPYLGTCPIVILFHYMSPSPMMSFEPSSQFLFCCYHSVSHDVAPRFHDQFMHRRPLSNFKPCCYFDFFCFHLIQDPVSPMFTCFWTGFVHDQIHSCWFRTGVIVRVFPLYSRSYFVPCVHHGLQTRRTNKPVPKEQSKQIPPIATMQRNWHG